jgi:hypothetical protein
VLTVVDIWHEGLVLLENDYIIDNGGDEKCIEHLRERREGETTCEI